MKETDLSEHMEIAGHLEHMDNSKKGKEKETTQNCWQQSWLTTFSL
jgi:hypothetical protein